MLWSWLLSCLEQKASSKVPHHHSFPHISIPSICHIPFLPWSLSWPCTCAHTHTHFDDSLFWKEIQSVWNNQRKWRLTPKGERVCQGKGSLKTSGKKCGQFDVGFPIIVRRIFIHVFSTHLLILLKGDFEEKRRFTKKHGGGGRSVLSTLPCSFHYQGSPSHSAGVLHGTQLALSNACMWKDTRVKMTPFLPLKFLVREEAVTVTN